MISLTGSQELHELDAAATQTLFGLLGMSNPPDVSNFLMDSEEAHDAYAFFFDVLIENEAPCAIDIDWRWDPSDIFWYFEQLFPEADVHLLGSDYNDEESTVSIRYQHGQSPHSVTVSSDRPGDLVSELMQYLPAKEVVAIDFGEDSYSWLVVPKSFDLELFCTITGLSPETPRPAVPAIPEHFAEGYKQQEKVFFIPKIIYVAQNGSGFDMPNQFWAGRVLPGQTIREGIAGELLQELRYEGRFDYQYDSFADTTKDRKGRDIKRYRLTVYLYDNTFQSKMAGGADIKLRKIAGKTFEHPDAA